MHVPSGRDRAVGPLMDGQSETPVADHHHRVDRGEGEVPAARCRSTFAGRDEQTVAAPGSQTGHRSHGEAAEAVADQPFPLAGGLEVAGDLPSETQFDHAGSVFSGRRIVAPPVKGKTGRPT